MRITLMPRTEQAIMSFLLDEVAAQEARIPLSSIGIGLNP